MKSQHQKGVVAVEFALILPVLILLLFGIVEFSLLLFNKQILTNASREGARFGIIAGHDIESIRDEVNNYCAGNLISFGSAAAPTTTVTGAGAAFGNDLTVTVTYDYDFLVLANFGFDSVRLTARTVMKME